MVRMAMAMTRLKMGGDDKLGLGMVNGSVPLSPQPQLHYHVGR
jgi:hypothetical protein